MRVRKLKNLSTRLEKQKHIIITEPSKELLSREALLPKYPRLYAEFGTGMGGFIAEMARRNPEEGFFGVDKYPEVIVRAAEEIDTDNVKLAVMDLQHVLDYIHEDTFDGLFLNFSDPWPKNRHFKRRLTYREFLDAYDIIMKDNSIVTLKTDSLELFQFTLNELFDTDRKAFHVSLDIYKDRNYEDNIPTEYEKKFSPTKNIMALKWFTRKK